MTSIIGSALAALRRPRADAPVDILPKTTFSQWATSAPGAHTETYLDALTSSGTLFKIVEMITTAVGAVQWKAYRRLPGQSEDERTEVPNHPLINLWDHPNPFMTRSGLIETIQQHQELMGESCILITRIGNVPVELWPVRPDKMRPMVDSKKFITSWKYINPDGFEQTVDNRDVIFIRGVPHPKDPIRGIGVIQAALTDIQSSKYSAEWNLNFFLNGATPGGIIRVEDGLSDEQRRDFHQQWDSAHRGLRNAHKVALLEGGMEWIPGTSYTMQEMQFTELRKLSNEFVISAFAFPRALLGQTDAIPRAVAEAQEYVFTGHIVDPRLRRLRDALNMLLAPQFGDQSIELDYECPIKENEESENAERDSKVSAAVALIGAGFDPDSVLEALDLPPMEMAEVPEPPPPAPILVMPPGQPAPEPDAVPEPGVEPADPPEPDEPPAPGQPIPVPDAHAHRRYTRPVRAAATPDDMSDAERPDLSPVQESWTDALDTLLSAWSAILTSQYASIVSQIRQAIDNSDPAMLTNLEVPTGLATSTLTAAMIELAADAAEQFAVEATDAGAPETVEPVEPPEETMTAQATIIAGLMAGGLASSAAWAALRHVGTGETGKEVAAAVLDHLESLTDAQPRLQLGGALSSAQSAGRMATAAAADGPTSAYYADETLDANTCSPCREVDGKWLGNTITDALALYPSGGYVDCEGGVRCRGQVVVVYRGGDRSTWKEKEPI